jgi:L-threonylcarbamoyladenylate synthase
MPERHPLPAIAEAVTVLKHGGLVAIPTETVYGLAADARNPEAVRKIFALKGRPSDHPLIVHISGADRLAQWAVDIPEIAYRLAERFWPGPLALVLNKRGDVPDEVTGGQPTVALRCPDNALTQELLRQFDGGLAAPSANRFGHISPTTAQHVRDEFGDRAPLILDGGPCTLGIESTIIDLTRSPARVLRPGGVGIDQLRPFLPDVQAGGQTGSPRVSGDMAAHYAPRTPLRMLDRAQLIEAARGQDAVVLCLDDLPHGLVGLALAKDAATYARALYASLRWLDRQKAGQILLERIPQDGDWVAVADRVTRAITGSGAVRGHE